MKLALVVPGPLDRRSGGYSYDVDLKLHLESEGHSVDVWSLSAAGSQARRELEAHSRATVDLVLFDALVHPPLVRWLETHQSAKSAPWVALVHHLAWLESPRPGREAERRKALERRFLNTMDAFLFNSLDTKNTVVELRGSAGFKPSLVCRPPVSSAPLRPQRHGGNLLFLANLTPRKNLHGLLGALGLLAARRPAGNWTLTVVGNPAFDRRYSARCRALATRLGLTGRVVWAGRVADLEPVWAETDLLVVPSFHEGWGMVYAEALVRGVVPLGSDRGGGAEAVGSAGLRVDPDDVAALSRALEGFLDGADRLRLESQARRRGAWLAAQPRFAGLSSFLNALTEAPRAAPAFSFDTYLEAKASVDTRSLHPRVLEAAFDVRPGRVLELGGGTGTMARRLRAGNRVAREASYELVDLREDGLTLARELTAGLFEPGNFITRQADLHELLEQRAGTAPDLVVAHAVLDLFDPGTMAPALAALDARRYWFTHIFDGFTSWEPVVDAELDRHLVDVYHRTMDERGRTSGEGSSRAGRDWLLALEASGLTVIDVAASDWVVRPHAGTYPEREDVFLHSLLHFFRSSLAGRTDVDAAGLAWWLARREDQVRAGEAVFAARQLDIAAGKASTKRNLAPS